MGIAGTAPEGVNVGEADGENVGKPLGKVFGTAVGRLGKLGIIVVLLEGAFGGSEFGIVSGVTLPSTVGFSL